jgi:hypothetical protein
MIGRRDLIRLLGGAGLTAGAGISPKQLAAGLKVLPPVPLPGAPSGRTYTGLAGIIRDLDRKREAGQTASFGHLPPHIAAMRSWSTAYKAHVHAEEEVAWMHLRDAMYNGGPVYQALVTALGLTE